MDYLKTVYQRFCSRRWEMAWLLFSGITLDYCLRINMSIAVQKIRYEVGWTENEKGLVLSAFYWGYMLGQLPVAWFVQRYGAKLVFGLSVLLPSILSLLVPIACRTSLISALFLRCLIGLFESACFPAVYYLFPIWIPLKEKSLMVSCIASGMYMGEMIGVSVSGIIADHTILINGEDWGGWPSVFYLFGVLGILWFPYWIYCAAESPDTHPSITPDEVALIKEGKEENQTAKEESFNEEDVEESSNNSSGLTMRRIKLNLTHRNHSYTQISSNTPERNPIHSNSNRLDSNFSSLMNAVDDHDSSDDQPVSSDSIKIHQKHHYSKEFIAHNPPWLLFFTTPLCYVYFLNSWTFGFMNLTLISEIPSFFNDQLGFNLQSSGLLGILPFFTLFVATVAFGMIFEYCQEVLGWKTRTVRQVAEYIAFGASSLVLIGCGFVQDRPYLAYFLMVLSQLFFGASQCGIICSYSDIAPNYAGLLTSIGNCLGSLAGICGPIIVSSLTSTPSLDPIWGWRIFFLLTALFSLISLVLWSLYQTSDIVSELNTPHDSSR